MDLPLPDKFKQPKFWFILLGILLALYLMYLIFGGKSSKQTLVLVEATHVKAGNIAPSFDAVGTVNAQRTAGIKAQVTGILIAVPVNPGDTVKKDQLLFQLDPKPFQASLDQAKATRLKDQAIAINNNEHYIRYQKLLAKGFVSKDDYGLVKSNKLSSDAQVKADQAAVTSAELQLQYTTITAPFDGRLSDIPSKVGDLITANNTTALTTINEIQPVNVAFSLPSEALGNILKVNMSAVTVVATPDADKSYHGNGVLSFIDNQVDASTGSIAMKAIFPNQDKGLWPGEFVKIRLMLPKSANAVLVPTVDIQQNQEQKNYVYLLDTKNVAHMQMIDVGASEDNVTAVTSGLKAGDAIITKGQFEITDLAHVNPHFVA